MYHHCIYFKWKNEDLSEEFLVKEINVLPKKSQCGKKQRKEQSLS